jgi:hypothetical protein
MPIIAIARAQASAKDRRPRVRIGQTPRPHLPETCLKPAGTCQNLPGACPTTCKEPARNLPFASLAPASNLPKPARTCQPRHAPD